MYLVFFKKKSLYLYSIFPDILQNQAEFIFRLFYNYTLYQGL